MNRLLMILNRITCPHEYSVSFSEEHLTSIGRIIELSRDVEFMGLPTRAVIIQTMVCEHCGKVKVKEIKV